VLEQDREMPDGCSLGRERHENLCQYVAGLKRLRRRLAREQRAKVAALKEADKA
jgi:hypothetical protein